MSAKEDKQAETSKVRPAHLSTVNRSLWVDHVTRHIADYMSVNGFVTCWDTLKRKLLRPVDPAITVKVLPRPERPEPPGEGADADAKAIYADADKLFRRDLDLHLRDLAQFEKSVSQFEKAEKLFQEHRTLEMEGIGVLQSFFPAEHWEAIRQHADYGKEPTVLVVVEIIRKLYQNAPHSGNLKFLNSALIPFKLHPSILLHNPTETRFSILDLEVF